MSVLWLLLILGSVTTVITNVWRQGNIDLTGRNANMRGIYARSVAVAVVICALLRVNLIDVARGAGSPESFIGWLGAPWDARASLAAQIGFVFEQIVGIAVTGVAVAFAAKFWNDIFDVLYDFKRWMRGQAGPGSGSGSGSGSNEQRSSRTRTVRRGRGRRRGGGGGGGDDNNTNRD